MPNPNTIEYSSSTQSGAFLRKGNFYLGVTDQDYGPTEVTGFYNGVTFSSGYLTYIWDGTEIRYNLSNDDSSLINFLSGRANVQFSSLTASLLWSVTQSNLFVINKNYENIVTDGLVLNLDSSFLASYPRTGNTWYDVVTGSYSALLQNGSIYNQQSDGIIDLDGIDDRITISNFVIPNNFSMEFWMYIGITTGFIHYFMLNNLVFFGGVWVNPSLNNPFFWHTRSDTVYDLYSTVTPVINRFNNITITCEFTGTNYIKRIYMNGRFGGSQTVPGINLLNTPLTWYIAGSNAPNVPSKVQVFKMYNRPISDQEVLQNYQSTYTRFTGENIVTAGLVAHLDASLLQSFSTASNTWFNVSGTGSNATLINGPTYSSADGGSIFFDGLNDYANFVSSSTLGREWTMSAWFNCFTQSGGEGIFNVFSANSTEDFYGSGVYVSSLFGTKRSVGWYLDNNWRVTANNVWQVNTWTHLVATVQGRVHRYYVNGNLVLNYTSSGDPPVVLLGSIGRLHTSTRYFPGRISQYLAYNRALSQAEIIQNFNATKARYGL